MKEFLYFFRMLEPSIAFPWKKTMNIILDCLVPPGHHRISVSQMLHANGLSQALRRRLKREGLIYKNEEPVEWGTPLASGDHLVIALERKQQETSEVFHYPLDILFEDDYFLVVNKPSGLLMHATSQERKATLANAVLTYYQQKEEKAGFHPLHRLDKNTSGIVVIAKTPHVQHLCTKTKALSHKVYLGFCGPHFPKTKLSVHWPITRAENSIIERTCSLCGQKAHTDVECLESNERYSLLRFCLFTGRTHQIRVHCAQLGFPLLGDELYGGSTELLKHHALHAAQLTLIHPLTKEVLHLNAPLPKELINGIITSG